MDGEERPDGLAEGDRAIGERAEHRHILGRTEEIADLERLDRSIGRHAGEGADERLRPEDVPVHGITRFSSGPSKLSEM